MGIISGNQDINLSNGSFVLANMSNTTTFTIVPGMVPENGVIGFSLLLRDAVNDVAVSFVSDNGGTIFWPNNNTVPTRTAQAGRGDLWTFFSYDGGTDWYGNIAIYNYT